MGDILIEGKIVLKWM